MQLTRRSFFRILGAAVPAAAIAPTYFFAPIGGWTSDTIINPNAKAGLAYYDLVAPDRCLYPDATARRRWLRIIEEQAEAMRAGREWKPARPYADGERILAASAFRG